MVQVGGHKPAAGLEVGDQRRAPADGVKVVDVQLNPQLVGDGQQMQYGVGGAAGGGYRGDGIFNGVAGDNLAGAHVAPQQVHDQTSSLESGGIFFAQGGGDAVAAHGRDAQELHDG